MADHRCANCGNTEVVTLSTCHIEEFEAVRPGSPVGYTHCPDCHHDTPWHLSKGQHHLVCSNRADRTYQKD